MTLSPFFNKKGGKLVFTTLEKQVLNKKNQDREGIKLTLLTKIHLVEGGKALKCG